MQDRRHVRGLSSALLVSVLLVADRQTEHPAQAQEPVSPLAFVELNGVRYAVIKAADSGPTLFDDGQRRFTIAELREHVAGHPPQVIAPALAERLHSTPTQTLIDLLVILRAQPAAPIARETRTAMAARTAELTRRIQAITRRALPDRPMRPEEEHRFVPAALAPCDRQERRRLARELDGILAAERAALARRIVEATRPTQEALAGRVAQLGGVVTAKVGLMNAMGVRLPAGKVAALAADPLVARLDLDHPGTPELDNQRVSLGLTTGFWAGGFTGGVHDVGVLDTGVHQAHPALASHPFLSNMGPTDTQTHGTGIAGILASIDANYRGVAYGCDTIVVAQAGSITTSMVGMNYIVGTGEPELINYSFNNGTATDGDYTDTDRFFDGVVATFGMMVSKSTGNGGYSSTLPTITHPAPAYNLLAVANMDDFNTIPRSDDRIYVSSSVGPTLAGRKKPDITAPGNNTMTTTPSSGFTNLGGTSAAAPHVGGGIVLLYDMGNTDVMACKAVLLNTTDAMTDNGTSTASDDAYVSGSLWNRRYGWGYLNLGAAYLHGLDVFVDSVPDEPEHADFRLYKGRMFADERATLVWQRHVAYNGAAFPTQVELLSDLDLFAFREDDGALLAASFSAVDNVEQLDVDAENIVVLKVEAQGSFDPDISTEDFAVATQEGFVAANPPFFAIEFAPTGDAAPLEPVIFVVSVRNTGTVAAHGVTATLSGGTIIAGDNPAVVGSLPAGEAAILNWTIQADAAPGLHPAAVEVASSSYGEQFAGSGSGAYNVVACTRGDVTDDGTIDGRDLAPFTATLLAPSGAGAVQRCAADANADGAVTAADVPDFVTLLVGP